MNTQHTPFFARQDTLYSRPAFFDDFAEECESWIELGDQIIVMVDLNDNVMRKIVTNVFNKLGLREAMLKTSKINTVIYLVFLFPNH